MKAVILNSGTGSRMGSQTENNPKCMVHLNDETTILSHQISCLKACGVDEFLITTGPFPGMISEYLTEMFPDTKISYVESKLYKTTNYIYSMYLADSQLRDDILLLHGDIVCAEDLYRDVLNSDMKDTVIIDSSAPLPEKDFKGRISGDGHITRIGIDLDGSDCRFLLPVYKLSKSFMDSWMDEIKSFKERDDLKVYAENALNNLLPDKLRLLPFDKKGRFCMEVDTLEDLDTAKRSLRQ